MRNTISYSTVASITKHHWLCCTKLQRRSIFVTASLISRRLYQQQQQRKNATTTLILFDDRKLKISIFKSKKLIKFVEDCKRKSVNTTIVKSIAELFQYFSIYRLSRENFADFQKKRKFCDQNTNHKSR